MDAIFWNKDIELNIILLLLSSLRKLCVAYNNVFRFLCGEPGNCSASHMFVSRGLPTCKMLIRKSIWFYDIYKEVRQYNIAEHCWK